jgi:phage terminase small subunit
MSSPLKNTKHEAFAQARFMGETADKAYVTAGYRANRSNAAQLNAKQHILDRIEELQTAVAEKVVKDTAVDATWVLRRSIELHNHCLAEPVLKDGKPVLDDNGNPVTRINVTGVNRAIELIGKNVAVQAFQEKAVVDVNHNYGNLSMDELNAKIAEKLGKVRGEPLVETKH